MPTPNEIAQSLVTLHITADSFAAEIMELVARGFGQDEVAKKLAFVDCLREVTK